MATVSKKCIDLVKKFEGLYTKAYRDEVGVWTIGYGITNADKSITNVTIESGLVITEKTANIWLEKSLNKKYLPKVIKYDKKYDWNQNEIDALVSFAYNIGSIDALTANGTRSRKVIAEKMLEYNKAGGRVYNGLTRRRKAERELFLTAVKKETKTTVKKVYGKVNTKTDPLSMRKSASKKAEIICTIPKGKTVEIVKKGTSWHKVKYNGKTGYCSATYIKI